MTNSSTGDLPPNPFWQFSLIFYKQREVTDACLTLQDRHGLDVNLLLFCIWSAHGGPGRLSAEDLRECRSLVAGWQAERVQPVRALRRAPAPAVPEDLGEYFHQRLLALELEAERVEQELLYRWARGRSRAVQLDSGAEAARNLVAYLALESVSTEAAAGPLRQLLGAAAHGNLSRA